MAPSGARFWQDGALRAEAPAASLRSGVFETLRVEEGALAFVERHLARLRQGARALGLDWPPPHDPRAALAAALALAPARSARLRLTYGRDDAGRPHLRLEWAELVPPPVELVLWLAGPGSAPPPTQGLKSTERAGYDRQRARARRQGAWDALLRDAAGRLVEGCVSNVYLVLEDRLVTPALSSGALPGILRGVLCERLAAAGTPLSEAHPGPDELAQAHEVLVSNALVGVRGVRRVLGTQALRRSGARAPLPGPEGPWARRLQALVRAETRAEGGPEARPGP